MSEDHAPRVILDAGTIGEPSTKLDSDTNDSGGTEKSEGSPDKAVSPTDTTPPEEGKETTESSGKEQPSFQKEDVPGGPLLIAAYLALWVVLFLFVFWTRKSQERLREDIAVLEDALDGGAERTPTE